jgi:CheY-like chemotaxis protein
LKVLCVDDEPGVLEGLTLTLRRRYEVLTAPGGAPGLQKLRENPDVAVILSDMRMPQMDGATFLERSREIAPDASRILLTGYAELGQRLELPGRWQVEVAAMLTPLSNLFRAPEAGGSDASSGERNAAKVAELIAPIPRLDDVRFILEHHHVSYATLVGAGVSDPEKARLYRATSMLRVATDFDELESRGQTAVEAVETMSGRAGRYDEAVLAALIAARGEGAIREVREVALSQLKVGMVFAEDVKTTSGTLLLARGHEVTAAIIARLSNYPSRTVREPMRVFL